MHWLTSTDDGRCFRADGNLLALLTLANSNYRNHTDWFLRHRETALKQLTAIIAAEAIIMRFFHGADVPVSITAILLLGLSLLSLVLAHGGVCNCTRTFRASLEHVAMTSKIIWVLAPSGKALVDQHSDLAEVNPPPFEDDKVLLVPRYLEDSKKFSTTEKFIEHHLKILRWDGISRNTYFWTFVIVWIAGLMGAAIGTLGAIILSLQIGQVQ